MIIVDPSGGNGPGGVADARAEGYVFKLLTVQIAIEMPLVHTGNKQIGSAAFVEVAGRNASGISRGRGPLLTVTSV